MKDPQVSQGRSEERSTSDFLKLLETYERLSSEFKRFESLSRNVEKERDSVRVRIYEKVKTEYDGKLSTLEQQLKEQEALLKDQIHDLLDKRAALDRLCREESERLEEIDFRSRVGEFSEEECKEERSEIEQRTLGQAQDLTRLEDVVSRCTKAGLLPEQPSSSSKPDPGKQHKEAQAGNEEPAEASRQPSAAAKEPGDPETSDPVEAADAFQIVEEVAAADDEDSPVVHCPPPVSSEETLTNGKAEKTREHRAASLEPSEYVTGYLTALEGSRKGERFPMISSNITLGNSPGIDIRMVDAGIANFHARILYKERKHFLENLDSMGRSFLNGAQVADIVELKDGDVIRLGEIKMQVEYSSAATTRPN